MSEVPAKSKLVPTSTIKSAVEIKDGMNMRKLIEQIYGDTKVLIPLGVQAANWKGFHDELQRYLQRHRMPLSDVGGLHTAAGEGFSVANAGLKPAEILLPQMLARKHKPIHFSAPLGLA